MKLNNELENRLTLVLGASTKPSRYAYMAIERLREAGEGVIALGQKKGRVADVDFVTDFESIRTSDIHTITLYIGPKNLTPIEQNILDLNPTRVIFNPGTEKPDFQLKLHKAGIQYLSACTLVMLRLGSY